MVFVRVDRLVQRFKGDAIHDRREALLGELGRKADLLSNHLLLLLVILSQGCRPRHLLLALLGKKS